MQSDFLERRVHLSVSRMKAKKHSKDYTMNLIAGTLIKLGILKKKSGLPFRSRLDGDHLLVLRLSEVVSV
jgi:hypothetical protein